MKSLTIAQLAVKFNEVLAAAQASGYNGKEKPVKRFATKESGIERIEKLEAAIAAQALEELALFAEQKPAVEVEAPVVETEVEAPKKAQPKKGHCDIKPSGYRILACREGTKQAKMVDLLSAPNGASMKELNDGLGWKDVTVRSGFSWDMKGKGYGVKSEEINGEIRYFLVVPEGEVIPPHTPRKGK